MAASRILKDLQEGADQAHGGIQIFKDNYYWERKSIMYITLLVLSVLVSVLLFCPLLEVLE